VTDAIEVRELGRTLRFTVDDALRFAGPGSPAGVAVAFTALQRAFAVLCPTAPPERRGIAVRTPFRGPGARDCFEAVTRATSDGRYVVDRSLLRADRGRLLEDFVFEVTIGDSATTLLLRDGFVTDEFIDLARTPERTPDGERRLAELKSELARQILAAPAGSLYDIA
jgi:hypothetical protein